MTLRQHQRHYYTRPAYTSDTAARLRRSRMRPWRTGLWMAGVYFPMKTRRRTHLNRVTWLVSLHTSRKRLADKHRAHALRFLDQPNHLVHHCDIVPFIKAFVSRYDRSLYELPPVPAPGRGEPLGPLAPRPGRQGAIRLMNDWMYVVQPGYRAGVFGVPWYRQKRRRKPKAPRFYTPDQFRRKVKAWDAIARAAAGVK